MEDKEKNRKHTLQEMEREKEKKLKELEYSQVK